MLIDVSIFVPIFRDKSGARRDRLQRFLRGRDFAVPRMVQLELLQGCSSEPQWETLNDYLDGQTYIELSPATWFDAARIHFDLKRRGKTVRSILACCIAQLAMDHKLTLVHNDGDFATSADVWHLRLQRIDIQTKD